jgi:hypothetical protein
MVRALLCEAANVLLTRVQRWSWLKRWGVAVLMHRMWIDGTPFRWSRDGADEAAPA